jgi:hypothetical protein
MQFDDQDRATIRAALLLAIDATKTELAGDSRGTPAALQRHLSAERLTIRFQDLLARLRDRKA